MRLSSSLDHDIEQAVQKFGERGVPLDVESLYIALQNSNSALKRRPKRVLLDSIARVLEFRHEQASLIDSEAEVEQHQTKHAPDANVMNRRLRANLATPAQEESNPQRMANGEPAAKRHKSTRTQLAPPNETLLLELGGVDDVLEQMAKLIVQPLLHPQRYIDMNVDINKGILLHGPPGCGKTTIIKAICAAMGRPIIEILGPAIVTSLSGDSEKALRERFDEARKNAPCVIFLDEIDSIAPKRDSSQSQMEKRIVAQLLTCMDGLSQDPTKPVIVVGATNRPDSLDPALRRGGRFDTEICIGVPNERTRESILRARTRKTPLDPDVDFKKLARMTAGFVGADLNNFISKAATFQLEMFFSALKAQSLHMREEELVSGERRSYSQSIQGISDLVWSANNRHLPDPPNFEQNKLKMAAFEAVFPQITPSSKREGFATTPNVSWADIGALKSVREEIQFTIVEPIRNPELYRSFGEDSTTGVLLWGPPGCGKTLLAKAAAAESKANFIAVKGPELLNKYVGESEASVRRIFTRARSSVPCIIFFDELDALVPKRDDRGSEVSNRIVNTLLTELDGLEDRSDIWVIGATNRPDVIDDAMLRPGRFGTYLYVDLPDCEGRKEIFKALVRKFNITDASVPEIISIVAGCEGYSGADLGALLKEAKSLAIRRKAASIEAEDLRLACTRIKGSVHNMGRYRALMEQFGQRG